MFVEIGWSILPLKKFESSSGAQESSAPQLVVDYAENRILRQNHSFEISCISTLLCSSHLLSPPGTRPLPFLPLAAALLHNGQTP